MRLVVDTAGRIVIPKALRDRLRLSPGTELEVEIEDDRLVATPVGGPDVVLIEENGRLVAATTQPTAPMTQEELLKLIEEGRQWPHSR
ncbi:MAG TPA: AbrB/MazE/SpoVT family DNA-binding domain-containing protein [Candidatus Dormibacteraeota bacterium]|nr:AbrB/MazE/SpoVT family DNA-binding domain-containing protein [Candidatus Dormibacteraeota bacterium]